MPRKKIILDLEEAKKRHVNMRPDLKEDDGKFIVNIAVEKLTDDNLAYVIANLRFYCYDARNSDYVNKFPFKIYETCWELTNVVKKKVAEFKTKADMEDAFKSIKEAYIADFKKKYTLTSSEGNGLPPRKARKPRKNASQPASDSVPVEVPAPAVQQPLSSEAEGLTPSVPALAPAEGVHGENRGASDQEPTA